MTHNTIDGLEPVDLQVMVVMLGLALLAICISLVVMAIREDAGEK